jgi:xylulokinase
MRIFLGLDASTQSLSALVVDTATGRILVDHSVNFGKELPAYRSPHGVLPHEDSAVRHSDPLMWVEALDLLLSQVQRSGFDWSRVEGVSGAGQQHGSVYLRESVVLRADGAELKEQVRPLLSYPTAPMWMDSSTGTECAEIAQAVGGSEVVLGRSGSIPIERFTGPQIRKIWRTAPAAYERTKEVHLVSSFMASLICGASVPVDVGDASGMNLMNLETERFDDLLLGATAPGLGRKLLGPVPSRAQVGEVHEYFQTRYGFRAVPVYAFTGDNPSSLVGMGATRPGSRLISLGTSDTLFGALSAPVTDPRGYGHVFGNPAGGFMSLTCFSNGSLAREAVAAQCNMDWPEFARAILESPPGNRGRWMVPFFGAETTPRVHQAGIELHGESAFAQGLDRSGQPRAVVEAQALLMRHYCGWMGTPVGELRLAGGASRNPGLQRVLADVFQLPVSPLLVSNASALGAALRAAESRTGEPFERLTQPFVGSDQSAATEPNPKAAEVYGPLSAQLIERVSERISG